jgi:hypothetical protein
MEQKFDYDTFERSKILPSYTYLTSIQDNHTLSYRRAILDFSPGIENTLLDIEEVPHIYIQVYKSGILHCHGKGGGMTMILNRYAELLCDCLENIPAKKEVEPSIDLKLYKEFCEKYHFDL